MTATLLPLAASTILALSSAASIDDKPAAADVQMSGEEADRAPEHHQDHHDDGRRDDNRGKGEGHSNNGHNNNGRSSDSHRDNGHGNDSRARSAQHEPPRSSSSHASRPHGSPPPAHRNPPPPPPRNPPPPQRTVVVHTRPAPPPPPRGVVVVREAPPRVVVQEAPRQKAPVQRGLDRNESFSLGLRAGSYMSGYADMGGYSDFGLGLAARYRPTESMGFELTYGVHSDSFNEESSRTTRPMSASLQLFAVPWSKVSPYAEAGLTYTARDVSEVVSDGRQLNTIETQSALFGPHAGLGLEFALGESASLNFEGVYTHYLNVMQDDPSLPTALQGTMGLNLYF